MGTRLWVGNLPFDATEPEIRALFAENGRTVASVILKSDRVTGRPAGFGFIEMGSDEHAQQAVTELNGRMLRGRPMRVNEARPPGSGPGPRGPRPAGPPGPGGGFGRGGGGGGFRRPFGGGPPGPGAQSPFGGKQQGARGRKERRDRDRERTEKPDVEKERGGGGKKGRFDGDDFDDD
jgi:RNA recognition motif-containing protein